ncbi:MAG: alpha/beta hydrolase [Acidipropionibacterium sp.]|jgi:pimeloyl-ACP methyl ester carboxylesterase|nr:alpha/beta hydrolase [Acidipropionibacterium sp.]
MSIMIRDQQIVTPHASFHLRSAGSPEGRPIVFLHGWPQDATSWDAVLELAATDGYAAYAPDLPGIGGSTIDRPTGDKRGLGRMIHDLLDALGLSDVTIVGHDVGGMITFAALRSVPRSPGRRHPGHGHPGGGAVGRGDPQSVAVALRLPHDPRAARAPRLGSSRPLLRLLLRHDLGASRGHRPGRPAPGTRPHTPIPRRCVRVSSSTAPCGATPSRTGASHRSRFLFYICAAPTNAVLSPPTPDGLREAGVRDLTTGSIPDAGHFAPEENPEGTWQAISAFLAKR